MRIIKSLLSPLLALLVGLGLGLCVTTLSGESPIVVLKALVGGAFGSAYDFSMTLFYFGPLVFSGLAVAIPFRAGLFNIGAEGQLQIGAFSMTWFALTFPELPFPLSILLGTGFGALCGALWGGVAGAIRAYRQGHEVIVTIMMNFLASALTAYLTLGFFRNPENQNTETAVIANSYLLAPWESAQGAPVSNALFLALAAAVVMHLFLKYTRWGYQIRALGENPIASEEMGFDTKKLMLFSFLIAGALAALIGVVEVYGNAHRFRLGFSADFGFMGIPVALLARGRPLLIPLSALLFAGLHTGASHLDLETEKLTREVSLVFQATVILAVSAEGFWSSRKRKVLLELKKTEGGSV